MEQTLRQPEEHGPSQKSKFWSFLKPDLRKIIIFLILIAPLVIYLIEEEFGKELMPMQFFLLKFGNPFLLLVFPIPYLLCGGWNGICRGSSTNYLVIISIAYLVPIVLQWPIACFGGWLWKKIFSILKKMALLAEIIAASLVFTFFILLIISMTPTEESTQIDIEKQNLLNTITLSQNQSTKVVKLQEIQIRSSSPYPIKLSYEELSEITTCKCNSEEKKCDNVGLRGSSEPIELGGIEPQEKTVYLTISLETNRGSDIDYYNELYVYEDVGNNNKDFCQNFTVEDMNRGNKVEIIRQ